MEARLLQAEKVQRENEIHEGPDYPIILTNLSRSLQELQVQAHKMSELQAGDAPKCFDEISEIPGLGEIDWHIETILLMLHREKFLWKDCDYTFFR